MHFFCKLVSSMDAFSRNFANRTFLKIFNLEVLEITRLQADLNENSSNINQKNSVLNNKKKYNFISSDCHIFRFYCLLWLIEKESIFLVLCKVFFLLLFLYSMNCRKMIFWKIITHCISNENSYSLMDQWNVNSDPRNILH